MEERSVQSLQYRSRADSCGGWRAWSSRRLHWPSDLVHKDVVDFEEAVGDWDGLASNASNRCVLDPTLNLG